LIITDKSIKMADAIDMDVLFELCETFDNSVVELTILRDKLLDGNWSENWLARELGAMKRVMSPLVDQVNKLTDQLNSHLDEAAKQNAELSRRLEELSEKEAAVTQKSNEQAGQAIELDKTRERVDSTLLDVECSATSYLSMLESTMEILETIGGRVSAHQLAHRLRIWAQWFLVRPMGLIRS
jgi:chromosome segregation ATPase